MEVIGGPTIFSNNWDRFGGRALGILNCYYVAKKLDLKFAFFWPQNELFQDAHAQIEFFSTEFQNKYRVSEDLPPSKITQIDLVSYTLPDARKFVATLGDSSAIGIQNFFTLPKFLDEHEELCMSQYADCAYEAMSSEVRRTFDDLKIINADAISIHARMGDLINGSWNQHVPTSKYVNTITFRHLLFSQQKNIEKTFVLSDSPLVVDGLEEILGQPLRSNYVPVQLEKLCGENCQDFFDLLTMAASQSIYAPPLSAFSVFAARVGGKNLHDIQSLFPKDAIGELLAINLDDHYRNFEIDIRGALKARDLVNLLQCHWRDLGFTEVMQLVEISYAADSDYVYAACIKAVSEVLVGNKKIAITILDHAEDRARSVTNIHSDPLAVVLLTRFCVSVAESGKIDDLVLQELGKLVPYQFLSTIAVGYAKEWSRKFQGLRNFDRKKVHGGRAWTALGATKRVLRYFRLKRAWKLITKSDEKEFLFAILELMLVR